MPKAIAQRSVYTILMICLILAAVGCVFIPRESAPAISLSFAGLGILVGAAAFMSAPWRRDAGTVRHTIVLLATIGCVVVGVKDVMVLMS